MKGFVLYKGAKSGNVMKIAGRVVPYQEEVCGFMIGSFGGERYVILDEREEDNCVWLGSENSSENTGKEVYERVFSRFHNEVKEGRFGKIVLSRRKWINGEVDVLASFRKACDMYNEQAVVLFSTEVTGTWLVATPEVLLEMRDGVGRTMALAGTMREGEGEWSEKNRAEQRVVADYIGKRLREKCEMVEEERVKTVKAGSLLHLRSDFGFRSKRPWNEIASTLHPTPAVCGVPTEKTLAFIKENEGYDRRFYSGYCGLVNKEGCMLYVTLRCMEIEKEGCWLYAGGGIMEESNVESEWNETENKMKTIRECIVTK